MATVILLAAADAAQVRGASQIAPRLAALAPFPLTDGRFYLGVEVLVDPLHADDHDDLAAFPQVDFAGIASLLPPDPKT